MRTNGFEYQKCNFSSATDRKLPNNIRIIQNRVFVRFSYNYWPAVKPHFWHVSITFTVEIRKSGSVTFVKEILASSKFTVLNTGNEFIFFFKTDSATFVAPKITKHSKQKSKFNLKYQETEIILLYL